jgi:hypothetical protein
MTIICNLKFHAIVNNETYLISSDVRWKIFCFLKSSLNISFFNLFIVALGLNEIAVTVDIAEYRKKEKLWSHDVIW